jgi:hypothetical protein
MRSIWRHVRLRKGFVNQERAPFGGLKLRIPSLLYSDKIRTQTRFMVGLARSRCTRAGQSSSLALYPRRAKQLARALLMRQYLAFRARQYKVVLARR